MIINVALKTPQKKGPTNSTIFKNLLSARQLNATATKRGAITVAMAQ